MKNIEYLERHMYAPELNTIHFTDGSEMRASQITTIEQAEQYIKRKQQ